MKIKSRKERESEYNKKYSDVSNDKFERLMSELGENFNEDVLNSALNRIEEGRKNIKYYCINFTFYEKPIQSHRARTKGKNQKGLYVPNAKQNHDAMSKFIKSLKKDIRIVTSPMKIQLKAYYPMPKGANPVEMILYETEHDYAIGKPDFDNVLKAYSDMLLNNLILDDDIVSSSSFDKYFSLKPRVELNIIYTNGYFSEYTYKTITSRKTFKRIRNITTSDLLVVKYKKKRRKK